MEKKIDLSIDYEDLVENLFFKLKQSDYLVT